MSRIDLVLLHAPAVYDFRERSIMFGPVSDMVPSTPVFEMYPLGLHDDGGVPRAPRLQGAHRQPRGAHAQPARASTSSGRSARWTPSPSGSTCTGCRTPTAPIEIARIVKKYHPDTPVIFGGLSSSYFHEELASYDCVDYVVRGDSTEEPMRRLIAAIRGHGERRRHPERDLERAGRLGQRQPAVLGAGRHERHLARLLVQHARRHPVSRHDGLRAVQGLAVTTPCARRSRAAAARTTA